MVPVVLLMATGILVPGCQPVGSRGVTIWNPFTWFSGTAGSSVDKQKAKLKEAQQSTDSEKDKILLFAQTEAKKTDLALKAAPPSRPVDVAAQTSARTVVAMDEALGPIPEAEVKDLEEYITALIAEQADAQERFDQEQERFEQARLELAAARENEAKLSAKFEEARLELREAFDRENALANKYRNVRFMFWGAIAISVVGGLVFLYLRIVGMGALGSIVGGIERIKRANPGSPLVDDLLTQISRSMNDREKTAVRNLRAKAIKTEE